MTDIVCVQNWYNLARRDDDTFIEALAKRGVAYVPFFPVGGFAPLQSETLEKVAALVGATTLQVAQAWLLQRAPNILLITGTSSLDHLRENAKVADIVLPPESDRGARFHRRGPLEVTPEQALEALSRRCRAHS